MLRTSGLQPFWLSVYPLYLTKVFLWERYKKPHCQRWLSVPQNWISMNWTAIEIHSNPSLCVVQTNHSYRRIFTLEHWELGTYLKGRKNHMKKLWFCDLCNQFLEVWEIMRQLIHQILQNFICEINSAEEKLFFCFYDLQVFVFKITCWNLITTTSLNVQNLKMLFNIPVLHQKYFLG